MNPTRLNPLKLNPSKFNPPKLIPPQLKPHKLNPPKFNPPKLNPSKAMYPGPMKDDSAVKKSEQQYSKVYGDSAKIISWFKNKKNEGHAPGWKSMSSSRTRFKVPGGNQA